MAERRALAAGLRRTPASIAPKYFYDRLGCALYGAICELPEYYPTRTERAIFSDHRQDIATAIGTGGQFVDLGAGDCCKAESWLPFLMPARYLAVDIAEDALARSLARLAPEFPEVEIAGIVVDFTAGLDLERDLDDRPATFFYPGSSIGNFTPDEARDFLARIHAHCASRPGSGLLIGVDTRKDVAKLVKAYADPTGVTAAFNRNVLNHVNRVIGTDFQPEAWGHVGLYDVTLGRVEMHLEALGPQDVTIDGAVRRFDAGERIHTENAYKYTPDAFDGLLRAAGFRHATRWLDDAQAFAVFHAR
ncbi:MAG: L-histidine N(alpha)-methyltransferase [Betaproteobacteria bacterium]